MLPPIAEDFLRGASGHQAGRRRRGQLHRRAGGGLRCGVRYDERLEQDMIAVPIGPRCSASPPPPPRPISPRMAGRRIRRTCWRTPASATASPSGDNAGLGVRARRRNRADQAARAARRDAAELRSSAAIAGLGIIIELRGVPRAGDRVGHARAGARGLVSELLRSIPLHLGRRQMPAPLRAFVDYLRDRARGG